MALIFSQSVLREPSQQEGMSSCHIHEKINNSSCLLDLLKFPLYLHTCMTQMYDYLEAKMIKLILHFLKTHLRRILVTISSAPVIFLCILIAWGNSGTGAQRCINAQGEVVPVRHPTPALLKHGRHCPGGRMGGRDCPWKTS